MAIDKAVDSAKLDAKFTAIADAIREMRGTSIQYADTEMPDAIRSIEKGVSLQRAAGSFKTNSSGKATVDCGFQPDFVVITKNETDSDGYFYVSAIPFSDFSDKNMYIPMWSTNSTYYIYSLWPTRTTTGFTVNAYRWNSKWTESNLTNSSFNYIAYKFTE